MNDNERIGNIQKALNLEQLGNATDGYRLDAGARHPKLTNNQAFNAFMDDGLFQPALDNVRRSRRADNDEYLDVIRVLEFAATRRLAIMML